MFLCYLFGTVQLRPTQKTSKSEGLDGSGWCNMDVEANSYFNWQKTQFLGVYMQALIRNDISEEGHLDRISQLIETMERGYCKGLYANDS